MSTIAVNTITDASGGNTAQINGATPTAYNTMGRNRIINGSMVLDQRNAGAAVIVDGYCLDRWITGYAGSTTGSITVQQNTDTPTSAGFTNSLKLTVTTADTSLTTQGYYLEQRVEGYNCSDFQWGSAAAKTVTVSFWVKASITGDYPFIIQNSAATEVYGTTYTINSANTWEYKTLTVSGDTSGTWLTTNGSGLRVIFGLGGGSSRYATSGWSTKTAASYTAFSGAVNFISNSGATLYITGVQLEVGSVATEFERRPYGTELSLCQRYCVVFRADGSTGGYSRLGGAGLTTGGVGSNYNYSPSVPFRAVPSFTAVGGTGSMRVWNGTTLYTVSSFGVSADSTNTVINYDVSSGGGQTSNQPVQLLYYNTTSSSLNTVLSAEL